MYALTSLSPAPQHLERQRAAVRSWIDAGLDVRSFNHPSEIDGIASRYDVRFIAMRETAADRFGRHFMPIVAFVDWARTCGEPVLLVNADIELRVSAWELQRIRRLTGRGLCSFVRYNHDGNPQGAWPDAHGFDAFLFDGAGAPPFADSFLCMGQPFWDYWVPTVFAEAGRTLACVEFPAAFHRGHAGGWSWDSWHLCAREFARVTRSSCGDGSLEACHAMASRVRRGIARDRVALRPQPMPIREWIEATFGYAGRKTFLELGAHCGGDTTWLARIPGVTIHAFEPDPRNQPPPLPNVTVHRAAVADADGRAPFVLSDRGWGRPWTYSSSLRMPKHHLQRYPVTFAGTVDVQTVTLDSFTKRHRLSRIDFIWADIQGAEGDMVRGGLDTLGRTHYLFTEFSDDELYEGQVTLSDLVHMLPHFRIVEMWSDDVLLENERFTCAD